MTLPFLDKMRLEVLISCMYQDNLEIAHRTNVSGDTLIINQSDKECFSEFLLPRGTIRMFSTLERGLSKSRNMAIRNSSADICLICDDDEILDDNYEINILRSFTKISNADVIVFKINLPEERSFPEKGKRMNYIDAIRTTSSQIAFRRKSIMDNNIFFDENMGSGTGHGGGEENKFLFDCLKKGLKIYYEPTLIASKFKSESKWFFGYTHSYFINLGWSSKKIFGLILAILYDFYFSIAKYHRYKAETTLYSALYNMLKGTLLKRESLDKIICSKQKMG